MQSEIRSIDDKFTKANTYIEKSINNIQDQQRTLKSAIDRLESMGDKSRGIGKSSVLSSSVENEVKDKIAQIQKDLKRIEKGQFD